VVLDPLTPQRRRELTRQHLIEAAAAVFAREGFYGASLDEVAAAAGFTKGAVYSNFKNKEDLFVAVLEDRMATQIASIQRLLDEDSRPPDEQLPEILNLISTSEFQPDWTVLFLEFALYAARNPAAREQIAAQLHRSRDAVERMVAIEYARRGVGPAIAPRSMATIALALFAGLDLHRLLDPEEVTTETLDEVLVLFALAARGMAAGRGAGPEAGAPPS
jgi:AcrR family transcriptional regulator